MSFIAAAVFMDWLYLQLGYVRLLGLAHVLLWSPAYVWVLLTSWRLGAAGIYGKYLILYLIVAGISLVVDVVDVARYLLSHR